MLGGDEVPTALSTCGLCEALDVSIIHGMCHCPGTTPLWARLAREVDVPNRCDADAVVRFVFAYENVVASRSRVIDFVGSALMDCMVRHAPHSLIRGEDEVDGDADDGESRLLAMLRLAVHEAVEVGEREGVAEAYAMDSESGADSESTVEV